MKIKKKLKYIRITRTVLIFGALALGVLSYVFSSNRAYSCREVSEKKIKQGDFELITKETLADDGFYKHTYIIQSLQRGVASKRHRKRRTPKENEVACMDSRSD